MKREAFDFDKEYGIVLEGGGAKGAYQIGVWKALLDYGVKIKGVAGVSVGALNGALMCMGDYDKAVDIWKNISYSSIMKVDDGQMDKLINGRFKELNLQEVRKQGRRFLVGGGLDVAPLRTLIDENVDEMKIRESEIEFIMGTFDVKEMKEKEITAKEAEEGYLKDYLMASSNFPLFKNEKLNGKRYLDGGMLNNVPIDMLINRGYKNIIVVRIYGVGLEKKVKIPEDVNVIYIAPKVELCNVLEFDRKKAVRNITLGYYDALRVLLNLSGRVYYVQSQRRESEYLSSMLRIKEDHLNKILSLYKQEGTAEITLIRKFTEIVLPLIATHLRLNKNWSYEDLYYEVLEHCAKKLRIPKFKIYTEKEFCFLIERRMKERYHGEEEPDVFVDFASDIIENNRITTITEEDT